jgi:DNA-binding NtrC family response regulator
MAMRILIVEDESDVAVDIAATVIGAGHQVVDVTDRFRDVRAVPRGDLDMAFIEVDLEDVFAAPVITGHVIEKHASPVILVTDHLDRIPADFFGAIGAVRKPFTQAAIIEAVALAAAKDGKGPALDHPRFVVVPRSFG